MVRFTVYISCGDISSKEVPQVMYVHFNGIGKRLHDHQRIVYWNCLTSGKIGSVHDNKKRCAACAFTKQ
jgi:hypothetical protein